MKKHQIILDDYLHRYQKFVVFYLFFISLLGAIKFTIRPTNLTESIIGLFLLICSYLLFVVFIGKKALCISDGKFYRGIAIADRILLREKIDISKYSEFDYEKKTKTDLPAIFEYSSIGFFSNYHECSVYLTKSNSLKRKKLISMSDFEMYYEVRRFLENWTELTEKVVSEDNSG